MAKYTINLVVSYDGLLTETVPYGSHDYITKARKDAKAALMRFDNVVQAYILDKNDNTVAEVFRNMKGEVIYLSLSNTNAFASPTLAAHYA